METPLEVQATEEPEIVESVDNAQLADEAESGEQVAEEVETAEASTDAETEEQGQDEEPELPSKQAKSFSGYSQDLINQYAKRLGTTSEELATSEFHQNAIKNAIDKDIFIQQIQQQLAATQPQKVEEVKAPEVQAPPTPEMEKEWDERLTKYVGTINSPARVAAYAKDFVESLGSNYDASIKAGLNPEKFVTAQSKAALNLVNTALPDMLEMHLDNIIERKYPGLIGMYKDGMDGNSWESVRNSEPGFKELPAYGTAQFQQLKADVMKAHPYIATMTQMDPKTNRPLSEPEQLASRNRLVMQIASGQKINSATVKQAIATGKEEAAAHKRVVTASSKLGAGKTKGGAFQTPKTDDFKDAIQQYMQDQRSSPLKD